MICIVRKKKASQLFGVLILLVGAAVICCPAQVTEGTLIGLERCYRIMIPALFPFLVISQCIAGTCSDLAGKIFVPLCRLFRIRHQEAGCAFLMASLGGFAPAAACLGKLTRSGSVSSQECAVCLCGCAVISPSFAVTAIGMQVFGSIAAGWVFFASLWISSLLCCFIVSRIFSSKKESTVTEFAEQEVFSFTRAVNKATEQMLYICGFVLVFAVIGSLLSTAVPASALPYLNACLELSAGAGAAIQNRSFILALITCGSLGLCGILQIRSLVPSEVSLLPLLISRPMHLAFTYCIAKGLLYCIPGTVLAALSSDRIITCSRLSWQSGFFFFAFLALSCRAATHIFQEGSSLRKKENRV